MINKLFCNCPLLSLLGSLLIGHTTYFVFREIMKIIHYELVAEGRTMNLKQYCERLDRMYAVFRERYS